MNPVQEMRPARRCSSVELFDGGLKVTLTDGVEIRVTFEDGRITLADDHYFSNHDQFHDVAAKEAA